MTLATEKQGILSRLARDRRGNFGMMTALLLPVLFGVGGMSIDLTKMMMTKTRLQDAADSAALAAASALVHNPEAEPNIDNIKKMALKLLQTQLSEGSLLDESGTAEQKQRELELASATHIDVEQTGTRATGQTFKVNIKINRDMQLNALTRLLVKDTATITANSSAESATEAKGALSMFLVLDRSGSMSFKTNEVFSTTQKCKNWTESNWGKDISETKPCYKRKIAALKSAVTDLMAQLDKAAPSNDPLKPKLVRTGAVSYNDTMQTETKLAWGTGGALTYVNALPTEPTGGTDSHAAFKKALDLLSPTDSKNETEIPAHKAENKQTPQKYIVFMTDGDNTAYNGKSSDANGNKSDTETRGYCDTAKQLKIEVYTVAFMAPSGGQELLKYCATRSTNYFEAENNAQLVSAFTKIGQNALAMAARLTH